MNQPVDPATDPARESGWIWRRLLSWAVIAAAHISIGWIIWASPGAAYLGWLGLGLCAEALIVYTFYFSGATVTDWAKLAAAVSPGMRIGLGGVHADPTPPPSPRIPDE